MLGKNPFKNTLKTAGRGKVIIASGIVLLAAIGIVLALVVSPGMRAENKVLNAVSSRLKATGRKAEILVTAVNYDEKSRRNHTTISFTEYGADKKALPPLEYRFSGNVIQIQSLVMRFDDVPLGKDQKIDGRKACLFWNMFLPDGKRTKKVELTLMNTVPHAYRSQPEGDQEELKIWEHLWKHALDLERPDNIEMRNAAIKAPGVIFIPGTLYRISLSDNGTMDVETHVPRSVRSR